MTNQELSTGQKAVGLTFNPSGDEKVIKAKQLMADAIDILENTHNQVDENSQPNSWIKNVLRTAAFNAIIAAQMALVKYLTWKD